ncbi:MAG: glycosyltransferase family 39 protein [Chloroflexi bacterium]|nr:glycosyltransferase family 39 protein [Chloroflexota bacterium]
MVPILLTRGLGIGLDDMFQYDMLARSLASGHGYRWYARVDLDRLKSYVNFDLSSAQGYDPKYGLYTSFRAPLYPVFLAFVYLLSGMGFTRFLAARLVQAVFLGAPLAPLTYFTALHFFSSSGLSEQGYGEKTAVIAAWLVACYPTLLVYPLGLGTENLFFVLLLASILLLLINIRKPAFMLLPVSGALLGLTTLTRSVILPFAGAAILFLFYLHGKKAVWAGIALILVITPWVIRNSLLHDRLTGVETSLGYNLYLGYHPNGNGSFVFGPSLDLLTIMDDARRDEIGTQKAIGFIKQQPGRFIPLAIERLRFFFGLEKRVLMYFYSNNLIGYLPKPALLTLAAILLLPFVVISVSAVLGLPLLKWDAQTILFLLLFVFYLLPHVFILSEDRFHLALVPFLAILAARSWIGGFQELRTRWYASNSRKWLVALSLLCVCLLLLNWGTELARDADKIKILLGPFGNRSFFPY